MRSIYFQVISSNCVSVDGRGELVKIVAGSGLSSGDLRTNLTEVKL